MFEIVKVLVIAACAYAGSAVASIQFPGLPDCNEPCTAIVEGKSLALERTDLQQFHR